MTLKRIELIGVILALAGSYIAAMGNFALGYPIWTLSSGCLFYTAWKTQNWNLLILQGSFLIADAIGIYKNSLHFL